MPSDPTAEDLAELIRRSTDANAALVRGDASGYFTLITHADDFTLMNPFGGAPTRGVETSRLMPRTSGSACRCTSRHSDSSRR
jgi:hypothetical protein